MSAATPTASAPRETRLDRLGIPHSLRWGFLGLLVFMTGNGTESNFIQPHMESVLDRPGAVIASVVTGYSLAVLIASYLAGALSDLWGPRRVMTIGFGIWVVFEVAFLLSLQAESLPLVALSYFFRGLGYPLFAFAFLVWVNITTPIERNGTAVGWFYVMFTGGLPTLGSLVAVGAIPAFGGGVVGETAAMVISIALVVAGFAITRLGVRAENGRGRIAPAGESTPRVLLSGLILTFTQGKIAMGFLVRLINTAPQYGMFLVLPAVIADERGWGQDRYLIMTTFVYATNIGVNAVFGAIGDRWGWRQTVKWFGVFGSAVGLVLWWYVPQLVPAGSDWGFVLTVAAGCVFGCLLAGFVPMGAIMPALAPDHKGAAMAMYTTAAGGSAFLGSAVVAVALGLGLGGVGAVWIFVGCYAAAFVMVSFLRVPQDEPAARAARAERHQAERQRSGGRQSGR